MWIPYNKQLKKLDIEFNNILIILDEINNQPINEELIKLHEETYNKLLEINEKKNMIYEKQTKFLKSVPLSYFLPWWYKVGIFLIIVILTYLLHIYYG